MKKYLKTNKGTGVKMEWWNQIKAHMNKYQRKYMAACLFICVCLVVIITTLVAKEIMNEKRLKVMAEDSTMEIVVLGDSITGLVRDETGFSSLLESYLDTSVENCAIGGASAALRSEELEDAKIYNDQSLVSLTKSIVNQELPVSIDNKEAQEVINNIDFSKTKYFLIGYGLNDYFLGIKTDDEKDPLNETTYGGALRSSIARLQKAYPDAEIVIMSPTYCQFYSYGKVASDSNTNDIGSGVVPDYVTVARNVAEEYHVLFLDNYEGLGVNIKNGADYLEDAVHFNEKGRQKLAKRVAWFLATEYTKEHQ